jgi:hypothetical protein
MYIYIHSNITKGVRLSAVVTEISDK